MFMYKLVLYENNDKIKVLYNYTRRKDARYRFQVLTSKKSSLKKEIIYKDKELVKVSLTWFEWPFLILKKGFSSCFIMVYTKVYR